MTAEVELFTPGDLAPADLAALANREHRLARDHARLMIEHAVRAGEYLHDAKTRLAHGEWLPWLEANFEGSARLAQQYMRLAANAQRVSHLPEGTSLRKAIEAVSSSSREVDHGVVIDEDIGDYERVGRQLEATEGPVVNPAFVAYAVRDRLRRDEERRRRRGEHPPGEVTRKFFDTSMEAAYECPKCKYEWGILKPRKTQIVYVSDKEETTPEASGQMTIADAPPYRHTAPLETPWLDEGASNRPRRSS